MVAILGGVGAALRIGKVGVVAPIASTEGAIAALVAIGAGESLSVAVALRGSRAKRRNFVPSMQPSASVTRRRCGRAGRHGTG